MLEQSRNSEFTNVHEDYNTHLSIGNNIPILLQHGGNAIGDGSLRGIQNELLVQRIQLGQKLHQFLHILVSISIMLEIFLLALFYICLRLLLRHLP